MSNANLKPGRRFELEGGDIDGVDILDDAGLADFFACNDFDDDTIGAIDSLAVGESYCDGGGASPGWSIKRIESVR